MIFKWQNKYIYLKPFTDFWNSKDQKCKGLELIWKRRCCLKKSSTNLSLLLYSKNNKLLITRIWLATFKDNVPYFNFWTISNKITIVMVSSVTFLQFSNSRICVHTRSSTYISNCWSKKLQFAISGRLDKVLNDRIYCEISKANQVFVFAVDALHL